jgi:putative FmdB family regulatory protein
MPLYEYRCQSCGERTEVLQHVGDAPLSQCPKCGGAVEKVISAPALQFKGSGWYVTDYGRSGRANTGKSGEDAKSPPAKPETKETPAKKSATE